METIKKKAELLQVEPKITANAGFSQLPNAITMCYDLTTDEKALYLLLLKNFNDGFGYSFPSWEYIKTVLGRGDGKVSSTLDGLERKGLIIRKKYRGRRNRYLLCPIAKVPCINLSEATYYFKKQAEEQVEVIGLWKFLENVIKSEQYNTFKNEFNTDTINDYLRFLQHQVNLEKGVSITLEELKEVRPLPF